MGKSLECPRFLLFLGMPLVNCLSYKFRHAIQFTSFSSIKCAITQFILCFYLWRIKLGGMDTLENKEPKCISTLSIITNCYISQKFIKLYDDSHEGHDSERDSKVLKLKTQAPSCCQISHEKQIRR